MNLIIDYPSFIFFLSFTFRLWMLIQVKNGMFIRLKTTQRNIRLQDYSLTTPVYINKCYLQKYTLNQKTFLGWEILYYPFSSNTCNIFIFILRKDNNNNKNDQRNVILSILGLMSYIVSTKYCVLPYTTYTLNVDVMFSCVLICKSNKAVV